MTIKDIPIIPTPPAPAPPSTVPGKKEKTSEIIKIEPTTIAVIQPIQPVPALMSGCVDPNQVYPITDLRIYETFQDMAPFGFDSTLTDIAPALTSTEKHAVIMTLSEPQKQVKNPSFIVFLLIFFSHKKGDGPYFTRPFWFY